MDIGVLMQKVKHSPLVSVDEAHEWIRLMETMDEQQLQKLESILDRGSALDMKKVLPVYTAAVEEAERFIDGVTLEDLLSS